MPEGIDTKPKSEQSGNLVEDLYLGVAEKTFTKSLYYPESYRDPYNPDDLYQQAGNYSIYRDMLKDDQVSVCLQLKKDLVIGSGWDIVVEDEDELLTDQHEAIAQDIEMAFKEDSEIPFEDSLQEVLSSYEFGFSLTEKVFKNRPDGSITLKFLKTRVPDSWFLHKDDHGNVVKYVQVGPNGDIEVDKKSLIHYINNAKFQNPYGVSDLRTAYNAWFTKRQIIKYYAIFMEKGASPTPIAKYNKNAPQSAIDAIFNAIKKFQTKTALAVPEDISVEFLESKNNGEVYAKAIDLFNMFIGRSLFIPDLIGLHGSKTGGGAYSLGKEQMGLFFKHIMRRREQLERTINQEIVWPLVQANYGYVDNYPKFKLRSISDADALEASKLWIDVVKSKVYKPNENEINHFRKLIKFPEGPVEVDEPIVPPNGPIGDPNNPESPNPNIDPNLKNKGPMLDTVERPPLEIPGEAGPKDPGEKGKEAKGGEGKAKEEEKEYAKVYKPAEGDYSKKTDFKIIGRSMDSYLDLIRAQTKPVVERIITDLVDQIDGKKILQTQKIEKFDNVKLRFLKDLKQIIKKNLNDAYRDSKDIAQQELFKSKFAKPLPSEKFLEFLEKEVYDYIGDWEYNISKQARLEIVSAIKDGKPISEVEDILHRDGQELSDVSIDRYARTKLTEVTNRARVDFFSESGIVSAYQYSAILDDRTTDICAGLHDKIFAVGTEPVPPMHFNCRSVLVPITKYEDFSVSKSIDGQNIDKFIENNKGEGFSKN